MKYFLAFMVLLCYPLGVPAPVPRCSPFILLNKVLESNSIFSDNNPYFPVPPCEYGNPINALLNKDIKAVSVLAEPLKIPLHNFYEIVWFFKTGLPRIIRAALGKEKVIVDKNILNEGYQHYTPYVRTEQLGQGTHRRPEIINNKDIYKRVVKKKIRQLVREGPDKRPSSYTPQGPLRRALSAVPSNPAARLSRASSRHSKPVKQLRRRLPAPRRVPV